MDYDQDLINQLSNEIDNGKEAVNFHNKLERLLKNQDFIDVIYNGYCTDGALRLVTLLKADSTTEATRANVISKLDAISLFQEYLRVQLVMGNSARRTVQESQATLDELRGEA